MALIKTVTLISPINMWTNEAFSELYSPEHFGIPYKKEVRNVTNPETGMQYKIETTYILENMESANQGNNKDFKYGLVPAINSSLSTNCESSGFYTLFVPKKISKSTISSMLSSKKENHSMAEKSKEIGSIKLRLNLKEIKNAIKEAKNLKKKNRNEKLLQTLLNYFVDNKCLICGFISSYESEESSVEHMKTHIKHNSLTCDCCNKTFQTAFELFEHKINHATKKPYLRESNHTNQNSFREHYVTHTGKRQHVCDICHISFTRLKALKIHLIIHTEKKPYVCNICNRSFKYRTSLKRHYLIQGRESPHMCSICNVLFHDPKSLKEHFTKHYRVHSSKKAPLLQYRQ